MRETILLFSCSYVTYRSFAQLIQVKYVSQFAIQDGNMACYEEAYTFHFRHIHYLLDIRRITSTSLNQRIRDKLPLLCNVASARHIACSVQVT